MAEAAAEPCDEHLLAASEALNENVASVVRPLREVLHGISVEQAELARSLAAAQFLMADVAEGDDLAAAAATFAKVPHYAAKVRGVVAAMRNISERLHTVKQRAERARCAGDVELRAALARQVRARERDSRLRATVRCGAETAEPVTPQPK
eukprot:TRINITY_DN43696_c0_g1_i1.p1 TRINITY_DN43696_c0_g1~~TRINITY_DN43696_c0_g1_i1.p1  ORF type:complete len:166 (+),score=63.40 TRINITY_DN43696_c0_g1_i1:47-499(+)